MRHKIKEDTMETTEYHPFVSREAKEQYLKMYDAKAKRWPVPSETRMVDTPYGQTFVRISGPADAPPLVLLSGLGGNSLFWLPQIKALSACYRTYAVDNVYDCGRSIPAMAMESPDDYVGWLDELFHALDLDNINLVGKSYGGWLAGQYAICRPGRLRRIVMMAPAATVLPLPESFLERMVKSIQSPREMLLWMYEDFARKDETCRKTVEALIDESILSLRSFSFRPALAPTVMEDYELEQLKAPVLFMVGENEKIYSAGEAVARLKKVAPHIRAEIIPGAGHDLNLVQAEMVNGIVLDFLEEP
jgi:pimeloyl-ACP methyl ester carboxylesterase